MKSKVESLEYAINCMESRIGLRLTIHDLSGELWKYLDVTRYQHRHALCRSVKQGPGELHCLELEIQDIRAVAHQWKQGRLHRCHAGFTEVVMPVFEEGQLLAVLFAGPFDVVESCEHDYQQALSIALPVLDRRSLRKLDQGEVELLHESLTLLAARIRCWLWDQHSSEGHDLTRERVVEKYLYDHYAEPVRIMDMAELLCVSEDRARHVIKELLGVTFSEALKQIRMKAACSRLLNTEMSVAEIGEACGIADTSCFTRYFKAAYGQTPHQWRKVHRGS